MKGTVIWVKCPLMTHESIDKLSKSLRESLNGSIEPDDKIIFTVGDVEIKIFNGKMLELTEEERKELIDKILKP